MRNRGPPLTALQVLGFADYNFDRRGIDLCMLDKKVRRAASMRPARRAGESNRGVWSHNPQAWNQAQQGR